MEAYISTKVSLVIRIIDDYDLQPIDAGISIYLNDYKLSCIVKPSGYYVFTNLKGNVYKINVIAQSSLYFSENMTIDLRDLNELNPLLNIRLKRRKINFLKNNTAAIKIRVFNKSKIPLENAHIKAFICEKNNFVGQVLNENIKASTNEILIDEFYEEFFSGDSLYLGTEEKGEFLTIVSKLENRKYKLMKPLENQYDYGKKFYKAFICKTDNKGNALIYFRNIHNDKNKIKIIINHEKISKEMLIYTKENELTNIDKILL